MTRANWTGGFDVAEETYETACEILRTLSYRGLQYNRIDARRGDDTPWRTWIPRMLASIGHSVQRINRLNVVQITATKGKGSTAAFVSSLLQEMGGTPETRPKIGRFTTPALATQRDQIAINGQPISEQLFAKHFFTIWNRLRSSEDEKNPHTYAKPRVFYILYCLAVSVFLSEGVDAAVSEVFSGGWTDCTNIVQRPLVSSVGSIGLDHVKSLGNTEEKIAKEKSGVYKPDCHAVTVKQIRGSIDKIIRKAAHNQGCRSFTVVHEISGIAELSLGIQGNKQRLNASLALTIVCAFLNHPRCPVIFRRQLASAPDFAEVSMTSKTAASTLIRWPLVELPAVAFVILRNFVAFVAASIALLCLTGSAGDAVLSMLALAAFLAAVATCAPLLAPKAISPQARLLQDRRLPAIRTSMSLLRDTAVIRGLANTTLPGRGDVIPDNAVPTLRWLLDCAHTPCSMPTAALWASGHLNDRPDAKRCLLFTIEPYRPARQMLHNIIQALQTTPDYRPPFDHVIFGNDILRIGDYQNNPSLSELDVLEGYWRAECCSRHPATQPCSVIKLSTVQEGVETVRRIALDAGKSGADCFSVSVWPGDIHTLTGIPIQFSKAQPV